MSARSWTMFAHEDSYANGSGLYYAHFGGRHYVELHGLDLPIVQVVLSENPDGEYWGWIDAGGTEPQMIWRNQAAFRCCFPYGPEVEVAKGKGEIVRLSVMPAPVVMPDA